MPIYHALLQHFKENDPQMYGLAVRFGSCPLYNPRQNDHGLFHAVVDVIISQQISTKAAASISQRVQTTIHTITPTNILNIPTERLRDCGLSYAKARTVHAFAKAILDKTFPYDTLPALSNEAVTQAFTAIHGIGPWTAAMISIFYLQRPDIFSPHDGGLQRAIKTIYGADANILETSMAWKPYRSAACWYLWQSLVKPSKESE